MKNKTVSRTAAETEAARILRERRSAAARSCHNRSRYRFWTWSDMPRSWPRTALPNRSRAAGPIMPGPSSALTSFWVSASCLRSALSF